MTATTAATITLCVLATAGILVRPWRLPEAIWPGMAALLLVATGLLPLSAAAQAAAKGTDVYLFLTGMMLLSETARREGPGTIGLLVGQRLGASHGKAVGASCRASDTSPSEWRLPGSNDRCRQMPGRC